MRHHGDGVCVHQILQMILLSHTRLGLNLFVMLEKGKACSRGSPYCDFFFFFDRVWLGC